MLHMNVTEREWDEKLSQTATILQDDLETVVAIAFHVAFAVSPLAAQIRPCKNPRHVMPCHTAP
jgi:hypothetical protein